MKNIIILHFILFALLSSCSSLAQTVKVGDLYSGGIVYRVDEAGKHGWIVSDRDVKDSITYNDALKLCDTLTLGGKRGWRIPTGSDWDTFDGKPGILSLVIAKKIKFAHLYYWDHSGLESSTSANARIVDGNFSNVAFYRDRSRIALRVVRKF